MSQSLKRPTSARVMISGFMSSSPTSGSLPSAQSLPGILCPPPSLPLLHSHTCSLALSKIINLLKTPSQDEEHRPAEAYHLGLERHPLRLLVAITDLCSNEIKVCAAEVAGNPGPSPNGSRSPCRSQRRAGEDALCSLPTAGPSGPLGALAPRTGSGASASTHPTSKMDLLFFTARARHFPPSLVILFSPSLQREPRARQLPAVRGLCRRHPRPQRGAPLGRCGLCPGTRGTHALGFLSRKDPKP